MNLYELTQEIKLIESAMEEWAADHDGDVTDFPMEAQFETLAGELESKALDMGAWMKNLKAESEAISAEAKALQARAKAKEARAERIKNLLATVLQKGRKYEGPRCAIAWRKSSAVQVDCAPENLPEDLKKITVEARKTEIKNAILSGRTVEGCRIVENINIQIK